MMADRITMLAAPNTHETELRVYAAELPLGSLAVGVDNIHHDVFLSTLWAEQTRLYEANLDGTGFREIPTDCACVLLYPDYDPTATRIVYGLVGLAAVYGIAALLGRRQSAPAHRPAAAAPR